MFPIYLHPAPAFRWRRTQTSTDCDAATPTFLPPGFLKGAPGKILAGYLCGHGSLLRCGRCAADLCPTSAIISRGFTGRWGRAYLVSAAHGLGGPVGSHVSLPNTHLHKPVSRQLVTGAHTVSDVSCAFCGNVLGWKYVDAEETTQKYKVGKFILETKRVSVAAHWEQEAIDVADDVNSQGFVSAEHVRPDVAEFDSQDEDECEDLFAGTWSPSLALKRRRAKVFGRGLHR